MEESIVEEIGSTITPTSSVKITKSSVWSHFSKFVDNGVIKAKCNYCSKVYMANSKVGTTNMHRHLKDSCTKRPRTSNDEGGSSNKQINQDVYREKLAQAVLLHGYAFLWAEHEGDRDIHLYLNENVRFITRNTMKSECLKLYHKNMKRVKTFLESIPGRICLTTDLWTSWNTEGYLCLTAHCIDGDWKLSSRILNFHHVPPPHSAIALCDVIYELLKQWGIEKKIFSITMDNALNMDNMQENLCYRLNNFLVCGGQFFHIRCCAHILNLIVQAGLKFIATAIEKVRESVKYVKGSEARKIKFRECVQLAGINCSRGLWLDVTTRWNSTYQMLDRAILYRCAFERLSTMDNHYKHLPSAIEWAKIVEIHKVLKPFQTITNLFSGSDYPTANLYFDSVWKIQMRLSDLAKCSDPELKQMAEGMRVKFNKYWGDYSHVLSFGVILDPRHKFSLVRARYKKLNDEGKVAVVKVHLENMFKEYSARFASSIDGDRRIHTSPIQEHFDDDSYEGYSSADDDFSRSTRTELDIYLNEPKVSRSEEFDILGYWKENEKRFPILSTMARDILSIPITTVASESSFSVGGRVLNKWRSRLLPENSEALITTRSWLYGYKAYGSDDSECNNFAGVEVSLAEQSETDPPLTSHV